MSISDKASRIKLVLFDVDGVLTDGKVIVHSNGAESKNFAIRDGIAMVWAGRAGIKVGFLSARMSPTTTHRAAQLKIAIVQQGVQNKCDAYEQILRNEHLTSADVAYMGDDVVDLAVLARSGLSAAPSDAVAEVLKQVDWISAYPGGGGAARELIELVLRAQNLWDAVVEKYQNEATAGASPGSAA